MLLLLLAQATSDTRHLSNYDPPRHQILILFLRKRLMFQKLNNQSDTSNNFKISQAALNQIVNVALQGGAAQAVEELEKLNGAKFLEEALKTNLKQGLPEDDYSLRRAWFSIPQQSNTPKCAIAKVVFSSLSWVEVLTFAFTIAFTVVSYQAANQETRAISWVEGFILSLIQIISFIFAIYNKFKKERELHSLRKQTPSQTLPAIRAGENVILSTNNLMVGDLVIVEPGIIMPAHCLVVDRNGLKIDESAVTGESDPIQKFTYEECQSIKINEMSIENQESAQPCPIVFKDTQVADGNAMLLILSFDSLNQDAQPKAERLPRSGDSVVDPSLISMNLTIYRLVFWVSITVFGYQGFKLFIEYSKHQSISLYYLSFIIACLLANLTTRLHSQGLIRTVCLAGYVRKMLSSNLLLRKLNVFDSLGMVTDICTSGTGVLTQGTISVATLWNEELCTIGEGSSSQALKQVFPGDLEKLFIVSAVVNSNASLEKMDGSASELALARFASQTGVDVKSILNAIRITSQMPFSSARKRRSIIVNQNQLFTKGASEVVIQSCSHFHSKSGGVLPFEGVIKQGVVELIDFLGQQGQRTLCLAYRNIKKEDDISTVDHRGLFEIEKSEMTLIGLIGLQDKIRIEVPQAIQQLQAAGVNVHVVSGDNLISVRRIAVESRINGNQNNVCILEGFHFSQLCGGTNNQNCQLEDGSDDKPLGSLSRGNDIKNKQAFDDIYQKLNGLARARPEDIMLYVTALQSKGRVVAFIGGGTNIVPGLVQADVGISLGIEGTEAARNAASILMLDDNFASATKAVMWGRFWFEQSNQIVAFNLTLSLFLASINIAVQLIYDQLLFHPIQVLYAFLLLEGYAMGMSYFEKPTQELMQSPSIDRRSKLPIYLIPLGQALFQCLILILIFFYGDLFLPEFKGPEDETEFGDSLELKYSDAQQSLQKISTCDYDQYCTKMSPGYKAQEALFQSMITCRHYTFLFNTFIMLQIFNYLNLKGLVNSFNVLTTLRKISYSPIIILATIILQITIATFGGRVLHSYPFYGLTTSQWLLCIFFGSLQLLWGFLQQCLENCGSKKVNNAHINLQNDSIDENVKQKHN